MINTSKTLAILKEIMIRTGLKIPTSDAELKLYDEGITAVFKNKCDDLLEDIKELIETENIYDLGLNQQINIGGYRITRVPGGWIYDGGNMVFVPMSNEFKKVKPALKSKRTPADMENSAKLFRKKIFNDYRNKYDAALLDAFCNWWLEPNKTNTKFRYEGEKFFDIGKRLATWAKRDFSKNKQQAQQGTIEDWGE